MKKVFAVCAAVFMATAFAGCQNVMDGLYCWRLDEPAAKTKLADRKQADQKKEDAAKAKEKADAEAKMKEVSKASIVEEKPDKKTALNKAPAAEKSAAPEEKAPVVQDKPEAAGQKALTVEKKAPVVEVSQKAPEAQAPQPAVSGILVVDDFNTGKKPNKLGGDFGSWDRDPKDVTQGCKMSFDSAVKNSGSGCSIRLDYDVDSKNPAYNGFWLKLNNLNVSKYKNLVLHVKGDAAKGYTTKFKVELKNKREHGSYIVTGVTDSWTKVTIPLAKFSGITNWKAMTELVIVFDDVNATKKTGVVNVDDVYFE